MVWYNNKSVSAGVLATRMTCTEVKDLFESAIKRSNYSHACSKGVLSNGRANSLRPAVGFKTGGVL